MGNVKVVLIEILNRVENEVAELENEVNIFDKTQKMYQY
jgi:hypothetical protein